MGEGGRVVDVVCVQTAGCWWFGWRYMRTGTYVRARLAVIYDLSMCGVLYGVTLILYHGGVRFWLGGCLFLVVMVSDGGGGGNDLFKTKRETEKGKIARCVPAAAALLQHTPISIFCCCCECEKDMKYTWPRNVDNAREGGAPRGDPPRCALEISQQVGKNGERQVIIST